MTTIMATQTKEQDDSSLARQAIHDVEAFAELYRRNLTRIYRYHIAHVGNSKDAEDLTSQTFMAALEGIRSFRMSGSFAACLFGIASKKRLMFFRRNGSRPEIPLEAAVQIPSPDLPTDRAAQQRVQLQAISRALHQIEAVAYRNKLARKHGAAKSLTILAHKLARAVYNILKKKEVFHPEVFFAK